MKDSTESPSDNHITAPFDSTESAQPTAWLLLLTAVPSKPDYLRVKLRRRMLRIGALCLKGAVYLLPERPETTRDFRAVRRQIIADGGEATLWVSEVIVGTKDSDLVAQFGVERDAEYSQFVAASRTLAEKWSTDKLAERDRLFGHLEDILKRDYFGSPGREPALQAMERLAVLDLSANEAQHAG